MPPNLVHKASRRWILETLYQNTRPEARQDAHGKRHDNTQELTHHLRPHVVRQEIRLGIQGNKENAQRGTHERRIAVQIPHATGIVNFIPFREKRRRILVSAHTGRSRQHARQNGGARTNIQPTSTANGYSSLV